MHQPSYHSKNNSFIITEEDHSHLVINLQAIAANYQKIKGIIGGKVKCAAAVKANAYGLGMEKVTQSLFVTGCRDFFVSNIGEGISLYNTIALYNNNYDIDESYRCYILHGPRSAKEVSIAQQYGLILVINSKEQLNLWMKEKENLSLPIVVHIDTGINRLGMSKQDFIDSIDDLKKCNISYLMSHLASSDNHDSEQNDQQRDLFIQMAKLLPKVKLSLASSGGILLDSSYHFDMVRPGVALYGGNLSASKIKVMESVITLRCKIIQKKIINEKSYVGYGATYFVDKESKLLIIEYGYADGLPCSLSNFGYAEVIMRNDNSFSSPYIKDKFLDLSTNFDLSTTRYKLPIAGRVSMDLCTIDASSLPNDVFEQIDYVEVINDNLTIDDVAKDAKTSAYEIITRMGNRYGKIYCDL